MPDEVREIDCTSAVRQLWDYLDGELDDKRMREVEHHLHSCQSCLPHADFGRRFLEALRAVRERHVMPPAVRAQVVAALVSEGYSPQG